MSNAQKTPIARSVNILAERKAQDAIQLIGKGLPCSVVQARGAIITVKFEVNSVFTLPQIAVPLFGPEYIRYPIQPGDKGMVIPADAHLGGMSGLGGGTADLTKPGNLSALVFLPFGNTAWASVDPNAVTCYGPNGVVLRDTASNSTFVLTPSSITMVGKNQVVVESGGAVLTLNSGGSYSLVGSSSGAITANSLSITDSSHSTSPSIMNSAWSAMVTWLNTHVHTAQGPTAVTTVPNSPFTGGNIAP